jgi:hypothetical protein
MSADIVPEYVVPIVTSFQGTKNCLEEAGRIFCPSIAEACSALKLVDIDEDDS